MTDGRHIFEDDNKDIRGNRFLAEVASIFEDNIRGVKDNLSQVKDLEVEKEIELTFSQLSNIGIRDKSRTKTIIETPKRSNLKQLTAKYARINQGVRREMDTRRLGCSTPTRSHLQIPRLEISQVSSINAHGDCSFNSTRSVDTLTDNNCLKVPTSEGPVDSSTRDMFHSCISDANCETNLSFVQQYLVEDRREGISFYERRHSSLLGLAGKDSTKNTSDVNLSSSFQNNRTYTISHDTKMVQNDNDFCNFHSAMKTSLTNISIITKNWTELSKLELEMSDMFNNISKSSAEMVNQLTRETACKASFNYLLLDPRMTENLPMKVFTVDDQELWRTFVRSVFYVGKGSRSRPFQHLYEAVKTFQKDPGKKKLSEKIK